MLQRQLPFLLILSFLCLFQVNAAETLGQSDVIEEGSLDAGGNVGKAEVVNENLNALVSEAEKIKKEIIKINQELYKFQKELLYPSNTQLAIFLSYSEKTSFVLDSIEINLDGKLVSSSLYRDSEIEALKKGGIQRIYLGSLSDGKHKLSMQFNGQGQNERYFRRKKILSFIKEENARYIQLIVSDNNVSGEPVFKVKQW
tara:strand:- start:51960 stop:52559 length:600 start_codon:yes stop_codon:yes gene_type:complete